MTNDWRATLQATLAPLREQLSDLEAQIETKRTEIDELQAARRAIKRMLEAGEPRTATAPKRRPGRHAAPGAAQANLDKLTEWMKASKSRFAEGFTTQDVHAAISEHGIDRSMPSFTNYLNMLQDQGVIRLDHLTPSNGKVFKLTEGRA